LCIRTEYAVNAVYGELIEKATHATYTPAKMTTEAVVDRVPDGFTPPERVSVFAAPVRRPCIARAAALFRGPNCRDPTR
jgi:hypothetical protein